ncbi:Mitochondrial ribosomal protein L51 / S25 / CI-B8 domain [Rhizoctonia solani]|uniref:Mitochondrial ribosomal protein L51 / S25 / CI-B8 domain n=1 Tax=Rhizoctonia solani TaxID=456999 RepID=A0A8H7INZ4_9AGAM|nr:Mitochondrial ribosomal protein L51 / S25 / CI-B8 domain [Rhizoctonia solani]
MSAPRRKLTTVGKSLAQLSKQPIPYLKPAVKSLRLDLAPKNGHWGARQLTKEAPWKPSLQLEFADGATHEIEVDGKRSEEIMKDLMKIAGGPKPTPSSH